MTEIYPPVSFYFKVSFNGLSSAETDARFQAVSGLSVEMQTENIAEGGVNQYEHILPTRAKYGDLSLKRGLVSDSSLIRWCTDTFESLIVNPISIDIAMLNQEGDPLFTWNVVHAWPKKWSVSDLNAEQSAIAIESLDLNYRYFTAKKA